MFDASLCVTMSDVPPFHWIEEEYVSRVSMAVLSRTATRSSTDADTDLLAASRSSSSVVGRTIDDDDKQQWIVEAKSIKSKLFLGLSSRWRLTAHTPITTDQQQPISSTTYKTLPDRETNPLLANNNHNNKQEAEQTNVEFEIEMRVQDPLIVTALNQVLGMLQRRRLPLLNGGV